MKITFYSLEAFRNAIEQYEKDFRLAVLSDDPTMLVVASQNYVNTFDADYDYASSLSDLYSNTFYRAKEVLESRGSEEFWIQQHKFLYIKTGDPRRDWDKTWR